MSSDYPSDWDSRRQDVYSRDGYQCQNCGVTGGPNGTTELHAHHIVPKSKGGTHNRSNLISLCRDCHNAIHNDSQAPTSSSQTSSISSERDIYASLIEILDGISDSESISNESLENLIRHLDAVGEGGSFLIRDYISIRSDIITEIFNIKQKVEIYESETRRYLDNDAQSDIDGYIDAVWASIQSKIHVISHIDEILIEFSERDIECSDCGGTVDSDAQFCSNCGKELNLSLNCESCGKELDPDDNFCVNCGSKVQEKKTTDNQSDIDIKKVERHIDEISSEVDTAINRAIFVELQQERFLEIWVDDRSVVWEHCPNCGFERGVLSAGNQAVCTLCEARWNKKGILNMRWEIVEASDLNEDIDGDKAQWEKLGRQMSSKESYEQHISELQNRV